MLTTKFYFSDQEEATKVAGQMVQAAEAVQGFGQEDGVRISPIIKPEDDTYAAQVQIGPNTPEFNMVISVPMDSNTDVPLINIDEIPFD